MKLGGVSITSLTDRYKDTDFETTVTGHIKPHNAGDCLCGQMTVLNWINGIKLTDKKII